MAHYDFCIWEDIELRASDPYDMIQTLNYRIMLPSRIIADFRLSTQFYISSIRTFSHCQNEF